MPEGAEAEEAVRFQAEEAVNVRHLRAFWEPTKEEKDVHETKWTSSVSSVVQSVSASRVRAHVRVERQDERAIPVLIADSCFMGETDDGEVTARCMPILFMKFDVGKWMHSHAVPRKGTKHPWGASDAIVQSGFLKTDDEPAIWELERAATRLASEETGIDVVQSTSTSVRLEVSSNRRCRRSSARCAR